MKSRLLWLFIFFYSSQSLSAQDTTATTIKTVVSLEAIYKQLVANHPTVKQAFLLSDMGQQEIRMARGLFDPKITSDLEMKEFKGKLYYQEWTSQLKIPTWIGVDVKAGYDRNRGAFLNPESQLPAQGLEYIGVSVPVGQGLLMDYRRAALREAQYAKEILEAERIKIINKTLLQAAKDYLEWYNSYRQYEIAKQGYELAKVRYEGVVERAKQGDAAAIDTTEALITLQDRHISLQKETVALQNAKLILSTHLWNEQNEPVELAEEHIPQLPLLAAQLNKDELVAYAKENHPELLKLRWKTKQLGVQRRLATEMLKPMINVNFNLLGLDGRFDATNGGFFDNNYKWGFNIAFPLLWRKERGKWQQTKIKQLQIGYESNFTNRQIINEIDTYNNDLQMLTNLLKQQENMLANYRILVSGEVEKFNNGESSLFLVNSRESKLLEAEVKFADLQTKYHKIRLSLVWAAGKSIAE